MAALVPVSICLFFRITSKFFSLNFNAFAHPKPEENIPNYFPQCVAILWETCVGRRIQGERQTSLCFLTSIFLGCCCKNTEHRMCILTYSAVPLRLSICAMICVAVNIYSCILIVLFPKFCLFKCGLGRLLGENTFFFQFHESWSSEALQFSWLPTTTTAL